MSLSAPISEVAQRWSQTMASTGTFAHNPSYASQIPKGWTRGAENIAAGYAVDAVVDGWINSPGHRANLLGDFTHIGIGYVSAPGTPYTRYFTQNFAKYRPASERRPRGAAPPRPAAEPAGERTAR